MLCLLLLGSKKEREREREREMVCVLGGMVPKAGYTLLAVLLGIFAAVRYN
jgi:hypothetical protein